MNSKTSKMKHPGYLNLLKIKQPHTAIVSFLHRISGILIFLLMPFMLYLLQQSLTSPENFLRIQQYFAQSLIKFLVWVFFSALIYHALAGIRHLLMDVGLGEHLPAARKSAWLVLVLAFVSIVWLGVSL